MEQPASDSQKEHKVFARDAYIMAATAVTPPPLFGTVLVARTPQESPSPLELQLRHSSARLRVVHELTGGAHLLLPGSTTIAIRVYFAKDLDNIKGNEENLVAFRNAFKYPICFFVLPPGPAQHKQLSNPHSFVTQSQLTMNNRDGTSGQQPDGSARVFIVPNVACAIDILSSVVQTLTPARRDLKNQFHQSVMTKNFVGDNATQEAAAAHVTAAFRNFGQHFELPVGEDEVLMSRFGSLAGIATADLSSAPIYNSSKEMLTAFFGSTLGMQTQQPVNSGGMYTQSSNLPPMNHLPMAMNVPYAAQDSRQVMNASRGGPFQQRQQSSNEYRTPPPAGMVPADERMDYSQFQAWQDASQEDTVRATPQLVSQQFVPRQQQHAGNPMYNHGRPPNEQRLLQQQFDRPPMGNAIRPFSSYSANSGHGVGDTMRGYFQ